MERDGHDLPFTLSTVSGVIRRVVFGKFLEDQLVFSSSIH